MPRPRDPYWHDRDKAYKTRIEGKEVILRHPDGRKVAHGDEAGVRAAVDRLLRENDEQIRRALDPTVEDICSQYLLGCTHDCEIDTLYGKEWILKRWCEFGSPPYGQRPAREIDATDLHRMRKAWAQQGYSGGMLRRLYREVMACWAWAARPEPERTPVKILEGNPLEGMRLPAGSPKRAKYVPLAALRPLLNFAEERAAKMTPLRSRFQRQAVLMLRFIAETGCRPKEACSARWEDFDPDQGLVVLKTHKTAKKTGKARVIVVPPAIVADLVALRDSGYAHPEHLFAHPRSRGEASRDADRETGSPWQRPSFTAWFRELVRAARKKKVELPEGMTLYWLRHSYMTDAQMALDGEKAANLAGNTKEITRGTYLHVQIAELRETAEKVAKRRSGED